MTGFDVGVAVLVLISAILATARGFTREILSLATWVGSAAIAAYLYFYHGDLLQPYFAEELVGKLVLVVGSFLVALIILHLLTMRIADFVVDSRIGPLDRTLGFVFGVARGVLIAVVIVIFGIWLWPGRLPEMVATSKSLPMLQNFGDNLVAALPPDLEKQVTDLLHKGTGTEEPSPQETQAGTGSPNEAASPAEAIPPDNSTDLPESDAPQAPVNGGATNT